MVLSRRTCCLINPGQHLIFSATNKTSTSVGPIGLHQSLTPCEQEWVERKRKIFPRNRRRFKTAGCFPLDCWNAPLKKTEREWWIRRVHAAFGPGCQSAVSGQLLLPLLLFIKLWQSSYNFSLLLMENQSVEFMILSSDASSFERGR